MHAAEQTVEMPMSWHTLMVMRRYRDVALKLLRVS